MQFLEISRDFGFWDLVRFWDFSKDFLGFLMKCTKIFRVIYPSVVTVNYRFQRRLGKLCTYLIISLLAAWNFQGGIINPRGDY